MNEYLLCITQKYADFNGRARRTEYGMFILINFLLRIGLILIGLLIPYIGNILIWGVDLFLLIPGIAVTVRRLHDLNMSGWWVVVSNVVPIVYLGVLLGYAGLAVGTNLPEFYIAMGTWVIIGILLSFVFLGFCLYLIFKDGDPYPNKYGYDPKGRNISTQFQQNNSYSTNHGNNPQHYQQPQGGFNQGQNTLSPSNRNFGGYNAPQNPPQQGGGFYNGGHNANAQQPPQRQNPTPQPPQQTPPPPPRKNNGEFNGDLYGKAK